MARMHLLCFVDTLFVVLMMTIFNIHPHFILYTFVLYTFIT